jgi:hypothetical protein
MVSRHDKQQQHCAENRHDKVSRQDPCKNNIFGVFVFVQQRLGVFVPLTCCLYQPCRPLFVI